MSGVFMGYNKLFLSINKYGNFSNNFEYYEKMSIVNFDTLYCTIKSHSKEAAEAVNKP